MLIPMSFYAILYLQEKASGLRNYIKKVSPLPISENIKMLRAQYHLSQKELAEIAGVTDKAVSTWESGTKKPRIGAIQKIADHFGLLKSNLIEDDGLLLCFPAPSSLPTDKMMDEKRNLLNQHFSSLNPTGQDKAIDYVKDLADNPKYKINKGAKIEHTEQIKEVETPYIPKVMAAHHPTYHYSEEDLQDIENIKKIVAQKKREKGEL